MLEPGNNEALKIETARRRTGMIRQYIGKGPVEIVEKQVRPPVPSLGDAIAYI